LIKYNQLISIVVKRQGTKRKVESVNRSTSDSFDGYCKNSKEARMSGMPAMLGISYALHS
ncbi:MAG: hypothetical protein WAX04_05775, partial [Oscillospiraceae bacterium]